MAQCKFSFQEYINHYKIQGISDKCEEEATVSGHCKFHDPDYLNDELKKKEIAELFIKKLADCNAKKVPLNCIGYNLPDIEITGGVFIPVYFPDAKITNLKCKAAFSEGANFHSARFSGRADFSRSTFSSVSTFSRSTFSEGANFYSARFSGEISFSRAQFLKTVFFNNAIFDKETKFVGTDIFKGITYFRKTIFQSPEKIDFDCDLQNVSFLETNIEKVRFGGTVSWGTENIPKGNKKDKFKIYDECFLEKKLEHKIKEVEKDNLMNQTLESILAVYRKLRDNYDMNLKYDDSGQFFIRESEMKRIYKYEEGKFKKKNWFIRNLSLASWYNILSQYGESYSRPIYITIVALVCSMFYFADLIQPGVCKPHHCSIGDGLVRAINAILPFGKFDDDPSWLDYVLKFVILPISATSFIAIRRKFERRLRH